jgi:hypothetical protein
VGDRCYERRARRDHVNRNAPHEVFEPFLAGESLHESRFLQNVDRMSGDTFSDVRTNTFST